MPSVEELFLAAARGEEIEGFQFFSERYDIGIDNDDVDGDAPDPQPLVFPENILGHPVSWEDALPFLSHLSHLWYNWERSMVAWTRSYVLISYDGQDCEYHGVEAVPRYPGIPLPPLKETSSFPSDQKGIYEDTKKHRE